MARYVYSFEEGSDDKALFGGKGAGLCEMTAMGIPVPPGFVITTDACRLYYSEGGKLTPEMRGQIIDAIRQLESTSGRRLGDPGSPLLVSVRSGAKVSMPGMMDTILNLGLNDGNVEGLARATGSERFAYDAYRRLIQMYGNVVLGLKPRTKDDIDPFEEVLDRFKSRPGCRSDLDLTASDLRGVVEEFKRLVEERTGRAFPQEPETQMFDAISAVFASWENERAVEYRRLHGIPHDLGTAVNVQTMVFGNLGEDSGSGVAFTRDPATGDNVLYGEYLLNAQGEDVVAGIRTPEPISRLKERMPDVYEHLLDIRRRLETHFRDMQDIEFTIENGRLWILQTRPGKRTGFAAVRIATDMVDEGILAKEEALLRIEPDHLNHLLRPTFDHEEMARAERENRLIAKGLNAGPGAASGKVYFSPTRAEEAAARGERVILVRMETSPEDIRGMAAAEGILTSRGGMTSHAALVARQMGKVCVVGCEDLLIDYVGRTMTASHRTVKEGDTLSLDGTRGLVFLGEIRTRPSEVISVCVEGTSAPKESSIYLTFEKVMRWSNEVRRLRVRANADRDEQARIAAALGAEGIGLCRTEHMFFEGERIITMRKMILAATPEERRSALEDLLPMQRGDFEALFRAMAGRPVTIRMLDPPLHEFLPHDERAVRTAAGELGIPAERLHAKIEELREINPMLGFRGCRLGISYPEITEMQARAIFEAACTVTREGFHVEPEVMIPLVAEVREFNMQKDIVDRVAGEVFQESGTSVPYRVGTMIEVPRAALTADDIAGSAEFFSFGTNDLTQMTLAISRDDSGKFIPEYITRGIYPEDPFTSIDRVGVGRLMRMGVELGRRARPDLKVGICGEHGGDPRSIEFCHNLGLDYVSCSPYRVPIAILAAAHASLRERERDHPGEKA